MALRRCTGVLLSGIDVADPQDARAEGGRPSWNSGPSLSIMIEKLPDPVREAEITFDPVREADPGVLLEMARAFRGEEGHPLGPEAEAAIARIAGGEPVARAWRVRGAGEALGYVVITLGYSAEYGGRDGFVDDLYLVPKARGRGLGRELLDFALLEASRLGIGTLHLEVEAANEAATRLYRSAGFEETGRRLMRRRVGAAE